MKTPHRAMTVGVEDALALVELVDRRLEVVEAGLHIARDVVATQELLSDLTAVRELLAMLGPNWSLIATDVTRGGPGNNERLGFIFDRRRVVPSGLAAELVVPRDEPGIAEGALDVSSRVLLTP